MAKYSISGFATPATEYNKLISWKACASVISGSGWFSTIVKLQADLNTTRKGLYRGLASLSFFILDFCGFKFMGNKRRCRLVQTWYSRFYRCVLGTPGFHYISILKPTTLEDNCISYVTDSNFMWSMSTSKHKMMMDEQIHMLLNNESQDFCASFRV